MHGGRHADRLEVAAQLGNLGRVRDFVRESLCFLGLSEDEAGDLLLAVDEAVSNVMMHGNCGDGTVIQVDISSCQDSVAVCIQDNASQYDPTGTAVPAEHVSPLDREQAGGFGVELIRRLVDRLNYRVTEDGRNELTLVKRREPSVRP